MISLQPRLSDGAPKDVVIATLTAAVLVLAGVNYIPVSGLAMILWILPISLIMKKRSFWFGMLVLVLTSLVVSGVSPNAAAAVFIAQFIPVGIFYGVGLKKQWRPGIVVTAGIIISILSMSAMALVTLHSEGLTLSEMVQPPEEIYNETMDLYQRTGFLDNLQNQGVNQEEVKTITRQVAETTWQLLPGLKAIEAMGAAVLNYMLLHLICRRFRLDVQNLPQFMYWELPWYLTWGVILGLAALLGGDYWQYQAVKLFGENLLLLFAPVLLVFGASVAVFFYKKAPWPMWLKIALIVLSFIYIWFTVLMLMTLGLFDPLFGYRKRIS